MRVSAPAAFLSTMLLCTQAIASDCAVSGSPGYFASGGFYSGGELIGNAFAIMASAGALCTEAGEPVCPKGRVTRTWVTQMVTAAHVVRALCEKAPDPAEPRARDWLAANLILFPSYKLERLHSRVSIKIDAGWCKANKGYSNQLPGVADTDENHTGPSKAETLDIEHSDIWTFTAKFQLPKRALITPYVVDLTPGDKGDTKAAVWGFSLKRYESFIPDTIVNKPIYFGHAPAELNMPDHPRQRYQFATLSFHGQSGSPVGWIGNDGYYRVFGILTATKSELCSDIVDRREKHDRAAMAQPSPAAAIDGEDGAGGDAPPDCTDPDARKEAAAGDRTSEFVPILRDPRVIAKAYADQLSAGGIDPKVQARLDARIDAAVTLFNDWRADPAIDRSDYDEALKGLLQGLSVIQRIVVLQSIKDQSIKGVPLDRNDYKQLDELMCTKLEPKANQR